jgi:hypothetical protein
MNKSPHEENPILNAALEYASMGFSVIPVGTNKKPPRGFSWKKWQSKKADEKTILGWWAQFPDANVAIITGAISGIVVVDVEAGGNIADLPETVTSRTGGDGQHKVYKYDPKRPVGNHGRIRPLTDIRGDGGYVIAPPSLHASGKKYEWLSAPGKNAPTEFPYWLLDKPPSESSQSSLCSQKPDTSHDIEVNFEGQRNDAAARKAGKLLSELEQNQRESVGWPAFKQWNADTCRPPLDEKELRTVWDSIVTIDNSKPRAQTKAEKHTVTEVYAKRFRDGSLLEAYYDPDEEKTGLISFKDGKISKMEQIQGDGVFYSAPPASNNLIRSGFICLPSAAVDYESEEALLNEIRAFIHAYVQIPEDFESIATFYALFSWVYDAFQELPYLRAIGDFGSGKSRFLKVMGALCYRPVFLNGAASSSAIFRIINDVKGTIILDEADFRASDTSSDIIKILNSGFQKGIPVFRSEGKGGNVKSFDPVAYDVFCPKVIATRKDFYDDALESRCINNVMETLTREDIPENLDESFEEKALAIRNKLLYFRFSKLKEGIPKTGLPKMSIEPRLRQIINPIYRLISDKVGKKMILDLIKRKQQEVINARFSSLEGELLQAFLSLLDISPEPTMKEIAERYNQDFGGKYPLKAKKVGTVFEQILRLQKRKTADGFVVNGTKENEQQIKALKIKYGIDKPEVNDVNMVNIVKEACAVLGVDEKTVTDLDQPKPGNT